MNDIQTLENERKKYYDHYKREKNRAMIFLGFGILGLVITFLTQVMPLIVLAIVPLIVAAVYFQKAGKEKQSFRKLFKTKLVEKLLSERFDSYTYRPSEKLDLHHITKPAFVQKPDQYFGEDLITGSYKGVSFEVSDCILKERVTRTDSKGNTYVTYETYFKGRWFVYTYEKTFKDTLKIVESRWASAHGLKKFETESIDFNKKFKILTSDEKHGFYLITPYMIEKFMELEKMHRGAIFYAFIENKLYIAINDSSNSLELPIDKVLDQKALENFDLDIELIAAIINEFRLDGQKFKNQ